MSPKSLFFQQINKSSFGCPIKQYHQINLQEIKYQSTQLNDELYMPLKNQDDSSLLIFSVWDKHTRYKNYLGELRLNVKDIFVDNGNFVDKTELKWYHLNSNTKYHSFVTGSILAGFELVIKNKKKRFHSSYNDKFQQLSIDSDVESAFKNGYPV